MKNQLTKKLSHISLIFYGCILGLWALIGHDLMRAHVSAVYFTWVRQIVASLLLFFISKFVLKANLSIPKEKIFPVFRCGFFLSSVNLCYLIGNALTTAELTASFHALIPVWGCVLTSILGMESITWTKGIGSFLACAGTVLMCYVSIVNEGLEPGYKSYLGFGFLLAESLSMASYFITQKPLLKFMDPVPCMSWVNLCASFMTGVFLIGDYLLELETGFFVFNHKLLWGLGYAILLNTGVAYTLKAFANKHLEVSVVSLYEPLQIVVATLLNWFLKRARIYWQEVIGVLMCVAGVLVVNFFRHNTVNMKIVNLGSSSTFVAILDDEENPE